MGMPFFLRFFDAPCCKSHLFHARNFRALIDFQREVFTITKGMSLPDPLWIIAAFHFGITDMTENPETGNSVDNVRKIAPVLNKSLKRGLFPD